MGLLAKTFTREVSHTLYSHFVCEKCGRDTRSFYAGRVSAEKDNITPEGRMYIKTICKITKDLFSLDGKLTPEQEDSLKSQANAALSEKLTRYHRLADAGVYIAGEASGMPLLEEINGMVPMPHCPYCKEKQSWAKRKDPQRNKYIKVLGASIFFILVGFTASALILIKLINMADALLIALLAGLLVGGTLAALFHRIIMYGAAKKRAAMKPGSGGPVIDWNER